MTMNIIKKNVDEIFLKKIKQEAHVISNIQNIVDKINKDGYLSILQDTFADILNNEISFAVGELKKMDKRNSQKNLGLQLTNNTYIFKENLKRISSFVIDQIWKEKIKGDKINDTIKNAMNQYRKGDFDEIVEEDEDEEEIEEDEDEEGEEEKISLNSSCDEDDESEHHLKNKKSKTKIIIKEITHKLVKPKDEKKLKKKKSDTSLELKKENFKNNKKLESKIINLNNVLSKRRKIKGSESLNNINYSLNDSRTKIKGKQQKEKILSIIRGGTDLIPNEDKKNVKNSNNSSFSKKNQVIQESKSLRDIDYSFSAISGMFKKKAKFLETKKLMRSNIDINRSK